MIKIRLTIHYLPLCISIIVWCKVHILDQARRATSGSEITSRQPAPAQRGLILDPAQTHHLQLYHHFHRRSHYKVDLLCHITTYFTKYKKCGIYIWNDLLGKRTFDQKPYSSIADWPSFYIQWSLIISHSSRASLLPFVVGEIKFESFHLKRYYSCQRIQHLLRES